MKKVINLTPLAEIGSGKATITDDSVEIEISGIAGGMKVWMIGNEEAEKVGNIVNGHLQKSIDTTRHTGILVTQSGRQMMMGHYGEKEEIKPPVSLNEEEPIEAGGLRLKKITQRSYSSFGEEMRYLLSNRSVYENYKKHGYYYAAEDNRYGALALKYEEKEENPLKYFGDMCKIKDGHIIVCIDKQTKKIKRI